MRFPTMCDQQRLRPACVYVQSGQRLWKFLQYSMNINLLTEHHLEFLSLKGGYTGWSGSTHVKKCHIVGNHMLWLIYRPMKALFLLDVYSYSCLHPLSNERKSMFKSGDSTLFEHGPELEILKMSPALFVRRYIQKVLQTRLIIMLMFLFTKTLHTVMTL